MKPNHYQTQREEMLSLLKDVLKEAASNSAPYSVDSYLPDHLLARLRKIIEEAEGKP